MKKLLFALTVLLLGAASAHAADDLKSFFFSTNGSSIAHCISYDFQRATMTLKWKNPNETREAKVSPAQYARLCALTDELGLKAWDGFRGANPHVLDGDGFGVHIVFADGSTVDASGYMNFPQGYRMAKSALFSFFNGVLGDAPVQTKRY